MRSVAKPVTGRRFSVVFLTYSASMSDALETIYREMKRNPQADVSWVPIPYYELQPDGSVGEMRFDGPETYPDWIECTDWRELDLAKSRPDVVFTFAPYDGNNRVTRVHEDFYCERLKKLSGLLVYVPYFVAVDELAEHFFLQAGSAYADLVVLQSARVRDLYRNAFAKEYGNRFGNVEDKFVALGSPKYDKVLEATRDTEAVPAELVAEIGERKVILLNTTLSGLYAGNRDWVRKLLTTMIAFSGRDDVFVWWRPHPLTEATLQSMRPALREMYAEVQAVFERHVRGLYDDTPDVHRAIAWSDAYYGDWSSLIAMYTATGKPMLVADAATTPSEQRLASTGSADRSRAARAAFLPPPHTLHGPKDAAFFETAGADLVDFLDFVTDPENDTDERALAASERRRQIFTENTVHADGTAGLAIASYVRWLLLKQGIGPWQG
ncbi:CDP-glycerol glycerophosphotransferase family protein [Nocardioides sp. BP30]|uniref:CDP-glycerol glycerophosphotransferase family protein n=1 Tax=Nocardioides sp. BP30 TaxID=3036374 RepID=UPI00246950CD|nr:CDP-glycerol glycerophosphotransferase family protein [Nocardioides sp. BP30]WGL51908.1 CDP-glycerol glycerophosphotransferase family protein [Nocardioides sp. BP30]